MDGTYGETKVHIFLSWLIMHLVIGALLNFCPQSKLFLNKQMKTLRFIFLDIYEFKYSLYTCIKFVVSSNFAHWSGVTDFQITLLYSFPLQTVVGLVL